MSDDDRLTHLDEGGKARMVDVTGKAATRRRAVAGGRLRMAAGTLTAILEGDARKGDVLGVARVAGIQAAKKTADLVPLCHALPGVSVTVEFEPLPELPGLAVRAEARYVGKTGVEMEALTAASVALLTVYDMTKAIDRSMVVEWIRLELKEGGASGRWARAEG